MSSSHVEANPFCLLGLSAELAGRRFLIGDGLTLGRSVTADVFLPDPAIGHMHCRIHFDCSDGISVTSFEHSPGVLVNGAAARTAELRLGDELGIGRFRLRIAHVENDAREGRADDPPHASSRANIHTGSALAARIILDDFAALPQFTNRLIERVQARLVDDAGELIDGDPAFLRIAWPAIHGEAWAEAATKTALVLHSLAYAESDRFATCRLAIGIAFGPLVLALSNETWRVWGPAADQSLRLALAAPSSATLVDPTDVRNFDRLLWSSADSLGGDRRITGLTTRDTGRRLKLRLAANVRLARGGCMDHGLLAAAAHDPQNDELTAVVFCKSPLEIGREYLVAASGLPIALRCRSCQPGRGDALLRAQFVGRLSRQTLGRFLECQLDLQSDSLLRHKPFAA